MVIELRNTPAEEQITGTRVRLITVASITDAEMKRNSNGPGWVVEAYVDQRRVEVYKGMLISVKFWSVNCETSWQAVIPLLPLTTCSTLHRLKNEPRAKNRPRLRRRHNRCL